LREISLNGYIDDELWFGDEITPDSLHETLYGIDNSQTDDVHIRLNSYGGSCNAAVRMHDDIVAYPGKVSITVSGTAASAATVLAMAADRLEMTSGSLWMIHNPSLIAFGNERDLTDAINLLRACKESIINVYAKRCRLGRDNIADMMSKTTWMDAQDAMGNGFIDGITEGASGTPINRVVNRADVEQHVQVWLDRRKPQHPEQKQEKPEKSAEPPSPDAHQVPPETPHPPIPEAEPEIVPAKPPTDTGTPVSQLRKRLALIMPKEAKNKEESQHE